MPVSCGKGCGQEAEVEHFYRADQQPEFWFVLDGRSLQTGDIRADAAVPEDKPLSGYGDIVEEELFR